MCVYIVIKRMVAAYNCGICLEKFGPFVETISLTVPYPIKTNLQKTKAKLWRSINKLAYVCMHKPSTLCKKASKETG